jgi:hypothetical protein
MAYIEFLQAIIKTNNLNEDSYVSKLNSDDKLSISLPAQQVNQVQLPNNLAKNPASLVTNITISNKVNASTNTSLLNSNDENLWYMKGLFNGSIEFMSYLIESFYLYLNENNFETYKIEIFMDTLRKFHAIYFKAHKLNDKEVNFVTKSYRKKKFPLNNKKLLKKLTFILNSEYQVPKKYFDDIIKKLRASSANRFGSTKHKHNRKRAYNHKNMLANSLRSGSSDTSSSSDDSDSESSNSDDNLNSDPESLNSTKSCSSLKVSKLTYANDSLNQNGSANNPNGSSFLNNQKVSPIAFQYQSNFQSSLNHNEPHYPPMHHNHLMQRHSHLVDSQLNAHSNYSYMENDRLSAYSASTHLSSLTEKASDITMGSSSSFPSGSMGATSKQSKNKSQLSGKEAKGAKKLKSNLIERFNDTANYSIRAASYYDRECSSPAPKEAEVICLSSQNQPYHLAHQQNNPQLQPNNQPNLLPVRHREQPLEHPSLNINKPYNTASVNYVNENQLVSNDMSNDLGDPNSNMLSIFILHSSQEFYISACLDETLVDNFFLTSIVKNTSFKPKTLHKIKLDVLFSSDITIRNSRHKIITPSSGDSCYSKSSIISNNDASKSTTGSQRSQNNPYEGNKYDKSNDYNSRQTQLRVQSDARHINEIKNMEYQKERPCNGGNPKHNLEYRVLESYLSKIKSTASSNTSTVYKNYSYSHHDNENEYDQYSDITMKTV